MSREPGKKLFYRSPLFASLLFILSATIGLIVAVATGLADVESALIAARIAGFIGLIVSAFWWLLNATKSEDQD